MAKKRRGRSAAFMRSINPFLKKKRKGGYNKVARRKKSYRRGRSSKSSFTMPALVGAGVYGAVRGRLSAMIAPVTSRVPLGTVADEVALLAASYFVAKKTGSGFINSVAKGAAIVEASRLGAAMADGSAFAMGASSSSSASPYTVIG